MCRVLGYLGSPILLEHLLYSPDSSLIRQSYDPRMLGNLNLAGFGVAAWDSQAVDPVSPIKYRTTELPVFDSNLHALSASIRTHCVLAHVRGVDLSYDAEIGRQNLHPFSFRETPMVFAHNGDLASFRDMRFDLLEHIKPDIARQISGSTDSEWIYALCLSQFDDPGRRQEPMEIVNALTATLDVIRTVRDRLGIKTSSSANLFVADGNNLVATRFTFDFGCYSENIHEANLNYLSLWFTFGRNYGLHGGEWKMIGGAKNSDSIIVSSEPLTVETSTWLEVPEYSALYVSNRERHWEANTVELNV